MPTRRIYTTNEEESQLRQLGMSKGELSAWIRERVAEAYETRTPVAVHAERLRRLHEQQAVEEAALARLAQSQARAIAAIMRLGERAKQVILDNLSLNPGASVKSALTNFLVNHPDGHLFRELVGPDLSTEEAVSLLSRWPDSRPELVRLIQARTVDAEEPSSP